MAFEFKLPDIGEGLVEGEIVQWLVGEGDSVTEDQPIVEVMTDKATVEITSPRTGVIEKLQADEGETVEVGAVIVTIDEDGAGGGDASGDEDKAEDAGGDGGKDDADAGSEGDGGTRADDGDEDARAGGDDGGDDGDEDRDAGDDDGDADRDGGAERGGGRRAAAAAGGGRGGNGARGGVALREREPEDGMTMPPAADGRILAAPAVRKLAREEGLDLSGMSGSGPRGRITRNDVEEALAGGGAAPAERGAPDRDRPAEQPPAPSFPRRAAGDRETEEVPFRGMRKRISEAMTRSKYTAPHFTYVEEVDMEELVTFRESIKPDMKERGIKVTYLPFIMKALVPALREFPIVNSSLDDESETLIYKKYYNIGISVDTEAGLMVPVVKDVDQKGVWEIAHELNTLVAACRDRSIRREDMQDGTFTITSAGNIGGVLATPIINWPEVAILGVNAIRKQAVVMEDDSIAVRHRMYLAISLDHRVVDGAVAARFIKHLAQYLEDPRRLILEG